MIDSYATMQLQEWDYNHPNPNYRSNDNVNHEYRLIFLSRTPCKCLTRQTDGPTKPYLLIEQAVAHIHQHTQAYSYAYELKC